MGEEKLPAEWEEVRSGCLRGTDWPIPGPLRDAPRAPARVLDKPRCVHGSEVQH